jgi:5'-nucleotidase
MHILVTNDDGIFAPGLQILAQAMRELGKVSVLAPDRNWSASGHVKTMERPLRVKDVLLADGTPALACDGAPSDCVALAMLGLIPEKIDIVVSGINPGLNIGHDVTYSGTVTAAMEAAISCVPGVAISLEVSEDHLAEIDYKPAAWVAQVVVQEVTAHGISPNTLYNVNVPGLPKHKIKGFRISRQGLRIYRDQLDRRVDPRNRPYYWIGGEAPTAVKEEGTDFGDISCGYISVTPLQLDLTDYPILEELKKWDLK